MSSFDVFATALLLGEDDEDILLLSSFDCNKENVEYMNKFDFDNLNDDFCLNMFRFAKKDLPTLQSLLKIPDEIKLNNRMSISGLESLCICLRRLSYPNRLADLSELFGRPCSVLSRICNYVLNHVYEKFVCKLTCAHQSWMQRFYLKQYAAAISRKGSVVPNIIGFIDGTVRPMCRPQNLQEEFYNGHKRQHAIKFQALTLPNGIIADLYGPEFGRRHDSFMLQESEILERIDNLSDNGIQSFYIYGDSGYPLQGNLIVPFKGNGLNQEQVEFNYVMSKVRQCVEWSFQKVVTLFAFLDYKKNLKMGLQPLAKYYVNGVIFSNCHTCLYGSQTSTYFGLDPPSLELYLSE